MLSRLTGAQPTSSTSLIVTFFLRRARLPKADSSGAFWIERFCLIWLLLTWFVWSLRSGVSRGLPADGWGWLIKFFSPSLFVGWRLRFGCWLALRRRQPSASFPLTFCVD
jgi:hypothetical protein